MVDRKPGRRNSNTVAQEGGGVVVSEAKQTGFTVVLHRFIAEFWATAAAKIRKKRNRVIWVS